MESIFHEKQEGSLCAQHCLNALLQGPYFTPVDLASLAQRMDDEERMRMAESGEDSDDYRRFVQQPSGNMDDSGYFSVQVISSALDVWGLDLVPFSSSEPLAIEAQHNPEFMTAYICNYRDHWFTIRKLGFQWFNLNSLLKEPELITDTYLAIFLAQLQEEGYSIFVVQGILPQCPADEELKLFPAERKPRSTTAQSIDTNEPELERAIRMSLGHDNTEDEDADLKKALKLSLEEDGEDPVLQRAIALSLPSGSKSQNLSVGSKVQSLSTLSKPQSSASESKPPTIQKVEAASQAPAITYETSATTLSQHDPTAQPGATADAEEIRRRRLAYLDKKKDSGLSGGS